MRLWRKESEKYHGCSWCPSLGPTGRPTRALVLKRCAYAGTPAPQSPQAARGRSLAPLAPPKSCTTRLDQIDRRLVQTPQGTAHRILVTACVDLMAWTIES